MIQHRREDLWYSWRHQCRSLGCLPSLSRMSRFLERSTAWSAAQHMVRVAFWILHRTLDPTLITTDAEEQPDAS